MVLCRGFSQAMFSRDQTGPLRQIGPDRPFVYMGSVRTSPEFIRMEPKPDLLFVGPILDPFQTSSTIVPCKPSGPLPCKQKLIQSSSFQGCSGLVLCKHSLTHRYILTKSLNCSQPWKHDWSNFNADLAHVTIWSARVISLGQLRHSTWSHDPAENSHANNHFIKTISLNQFFRAASS